MGKLNIAHHKSYHPYRRDNIERVRRDEEEAARQDAEQEGRIALADAEARLTLLRTRAGIGGKEKERSEAVERSGLGTGIGSGKHINLFEDLEQQATVAAMRATKKTAPSEAEKGVPLAPSAKDLHPWYADKTHDRGQMGEEQDDERRKKDLRVKSMYDPLTSLTRSSQPTTQSRRSDPPKQLDPMTARLTRESSERERALALIRRKKRELAGSETPSTVHGGVDEGYGDVYNKRAVEEAHAHRERWRRRGW